MDTATLPSPSRDHGSTPRSADRVRRALRGPVTDPVWARAGLIALLVLTGAVYIYNLTAGGWANSFYAAAVQAGSVSWKAFFFGSFDAGNAITVDKPPASLWLMALSVRLLGLSSFAMLLPQVLIGVGTVGVVHATVRRRFGAGAALLAGLSLALTPVAVLMFRFNNPDALLTLLMALAIWASLRAVEAGSVRWIALAGVFTGLGFLTKSLQVLLVVPAVAVVWPVCADAPVRRRLLGGLASAAAFVVSAGWWVAVVELMPASLRPYIDGSQTNSFLELTFGYNGLGRLDGSEVGKVGGGGGPFSSGVGLFRMFDSSAAGQISWLLPAALVMLVGGVALRGRTPRTDLRRATYLATGLWMLTTALVFSYMQGIFHEYYTVALAPPVAALVGMGAGEAWQRRRSLLGALVLASATGVTAGWSFVLLSRTTAYGSGLRVGVLAVGLAATLLLLVVGRLHRRAVLPVAAAAVVAGLAGPAAYDATTLSTANSGSIVTAGPSTGGPGGGARPGGGPPGGGFGGPPGGTTTGAGGMRGLLDATTPDAAVVAALKAGAAHYTWVAAAVGSQNAAGLQLATRLPVMAIGGFNGSDPSPTLAQFQEYVAQGRIHYFVAGGGFRGQQGGSNAASEIDTWVGQHYTAVTLGGQTFYDLTQPTEATS
ncbi:ArnT family glycosyltransferase [Phycicoccus duodecadis]|uniref:4-amino-4-deoxy-L-arabinose transferase-like glycosyltransferase n=1 Tax=Phycicoccus duodecadis TaxID=173053 RepID=A0A2N3YJ19_9MICO|nr:glycosyltransferase family 39 protein [Phycicoccus duodecadis]PKW26829.1 4-amino-4-deoxy-L-arabinose transferase-like glycosyltransferase [Phycicoccus duodecadis]